MSAWLIPTTDGLILIDTVQEPYVDHVLNSVRNVGYDQHPFVDPASWRGWTERLTMVADKFVADEKAKASSAAAR